MPSENQGHYRDGTEATAPEPDFDALARAAVGDGVGPREAMDLLFSAVLRLEMWHFIARGDAPNYKPYGARNSGIADGAGMLKAFTDTRRLQAFARENGLVDEHGAVLTLSLPVHNVQPTLEDYAAQGATHVHFNADAASDGFYIPVVQLPVIRRHLAAKGMV
jgi:hypothetical protein